MVKNVGRLGKLESERSNSLERIVKNVQIHLQNQSAFQFEQIFLQKFYDNEEERRKTKLKLVDLSVLSVGTISAA